MNAEQQLARSCGRDRRGLLTLLADLAQPTVISKEAVPPTPCQGLRVVDIWFLAEMHALPAWYIEINISFQGSVQAARGSGKKWRRTYVNGSYHL